MTREIELTQGRVALVDDGAYEYLSQWKWTYSQGRAIRRSPRPVSKPIHMHREILGFYGVEIGNLKVDHIDRNPLNNTLINLRVCSQAQNVCNSSLRIDNKSGFKGVSFVQSRKRWLATIRSNGRSVNLGSYASPYVAAIVYNDAAVRFFGEFANLNRLPDFVVDETHKYLATHSTATALGRKREHHFAQELQKRITDWQAQHPARPSVTANGVNESTEAA